MSIDSIDTVQVIDSVNDNAGFNQLNFLFEFDHIDIGGRNFLYTTSLEAVAGGLAAIELFQDGSLGEVTDLTNFTFDFNDVGVGAEGIETALIGGVPFVFTTSGGTIGVYLLTQSGEPVLATSFSDNFLTSLRGTLDLEVVAAPNGKQFLVTSALFDGALTLWRVDDPLAGIFPVNQVGVTTPSDAEIVLVGDEIYVYASETDARGIEIFRLDTDLDVLIPIGRFGDSITVLGSNYDRIRSLTSAEIGDQKFLISSAQNGSIVVHEISSSGSLVERFVLGISSFQVNVAYINSEPILISANLGGVDLYSLASDGSLILLESLRDDFSVNLNGTTWADLINIGDKNFLISAASVDDGLTVFELTATTSSSDDPPSETPVDSSGHTQGPDNVTGSSGDDFISGLGGDDTMRAGIGDDTVLGGDGDDHMIGQGGNDRLVGQAGNDFAKGNGGNDFLKGSGGDDTLIGGGGEDSLRGNGGNDSLKGGGGADGLKGGGGNDTILGNGGADDIKGGGGDDVINAGRGDDIIKGNGGSDTIQFRTGDGSDTVNGFQQGHDLIEILAGVTGFDDFDISQNGDNVRIEFANVDITVINARAGQFTEDDFIF